MFKDPVEMVFIRAFGGHVDHKTFKEAKDGILFAVVFGPVADLEHDY